MLTDFAYTQFIFLSLTKQDQMVLLKYNIPLYLQYVLGRYFSAETGVEQLSWILEGQFSGESIEEVSKLSKIYLREFNQSVNLFPTSDMAELYSHFCENVGIFYPFPQHCNGLVANMLLYHTCDAIMPELTEAKRISCIFQEAKELVKLGFCHLDRALSINGGDNIGPLIHTLDRMKNIFGTCRVNSQSEGIIRTLPRGLTISFTDSEGAWYRKSFADFEAACRSVVPTREYMDDVIRLLGRHEPVSERYMGNWISMMTERMRRVVKIQPEFERLSDREQIELLNRNSRHAITLMAVRLDLCRSGKEQFRGCVGVVDSRNTEWEQEYKDQIDLEALRSHHLDDEMLNLGRMDEASIDTMYSIHKEVTDICTNDQMYHLMTVLTLLDFTDLNVSSSFRGILRTRQLYLNLFQRKLRAAECSYVDYLSFRKTLDKVRILTDLMNNLFCPGQPSSK